VTTLVVVTSGDDGNEGMMVTGDYGAVVTIMIVIITMLGSTVMIVMTVVIMLMLNMLEITRVMKMDV
jgi:hypothetical protein